MAQLVEVKEINMALLEQKSDLNNNIEKQVRDVVDLK